MLTTKLAEAAAGIGIIVIVAVAAAALYYGRLGASDVGGGGLPTVVVVKPGFVGQTPPAETTPQAKRADAVLSAGAAAQRAITFIEQDHTGSASAFTTQSLSERTHAQLSTYGSLPDTINLKGAPARFVKDYPVWVVTITGPFGNLPLSASVPPGFKPPIYDKAVYYLDGYDGTLLVQAWVPNAASVAVIQTAAAATLVAKTSAATTAPTP